MDRAIALGGGARAERALVTGRMLVAAAIRPGMRVLLSAAPPATRQRCSPDSAPKFTPSRNRVT